MGGRARLRGRPTGAPPDDEDAAAEPPAYEDAGRPRDAAGAKDVAGASDAPAAAPTDASAAPDSAPPERDAGRPDLPPYSGPAMRIEHNVKPADTDPAIDKWLEDHIAVLDTRVPPVGKLYLFLAGGNGTPQKEIEMLDVAAGWGLHALGPRFTTDVLVADVCPEDPDSGLLGQRAQGGARGDRHEPAPRGHARELAVEPGGEAARPPRAEVPDRGLGRVPRRRGGALVRGDRRGALARLVGGGVRGDAAIGVPRGDALGAGRLRLELHAEAAPWLKETSLTAPERFWGFSHTQDPGHADQLRAWAALGLPGAPTKVEGAQPPYGGSHQLITSVAPPGGAGGAHGSTTAGGGSPKLGDGSYRFAPVWAR